MEQLSGAVKVGALPAVTVAKRRAGKLARYGVGEEITLAPQQSLPTGRGPTAAWVLKSGAGSVQNLGNNRAKYTAGDLGSAQLLRGERSYQATLELRDTRGELAVVRLTVVAPDSCGLLKLGPRHDQGWANSGFWGQHVIGPDDVSFMNIEVKESRGTIIADGVHAHERGTIHAVTAVWLPTLKVAAAGTLLNANDRVWTPAPNPPKGGWIPGDATVAGNFTWDIAWMYRVAGDASPSGLQFGKAWHKAKTLQSGRMTVSKGGADHTADMADATVNYVDICPLPLL